MSEATDAEYEALYKMAMDAIGLAADMLTQNADTYAALIKAERSMHIMDPTLYIRALNDRGLYQQVKLCSAALAFILVVQEIKRELAAGPAA